MCRVVYLPEPTRHRGGPATSRRSCRKGNPLVEHRLKTMECARSEWLNIAAEGRPTDVANTGWKKASSDESFIGDVISYSLWTSISSTTHVFAQLTKGTNNGIRQWDEQHWHIGFSYIVREEYHRRLTVVHDQCNRTCIALIHLRRHLL
jgi:hypothetical protein